MHSLKALGEYTHTHTPCVYKNVVQTEDCNILDDSAVYLACLNFNFLNIKKNKKIEKL